MEAPETTPTTPAELAKLVSIMEEDLERINNSTPSSPGPFPPYIMDLDSGINDLDSDPDDPDPMPGPTMHTRQEESPTTTLPTMMDISSRFSNELPLTCVPALRPGLPPMPKIFVRTDMTPLASMTDRQPGDLLNI